MIARSDAHDAERGDRDAQLMARASAGDTAAFDELTERYRPYVLAHVTRLMGHDRYSEDLAQEVFLRAYRARGSYVARARFSTWLFIIIRNVAHNARRWLSRHPALSLKAVSIATGSPAPLMDVASDDRQPSQDLMRSEECEFVRSAISQLCQRQQLAVYYRYYSGLSYARRGAGARHLAPGGQIAALSCAGAFAWPPGPVHGRRHRAPRQRSQLVDRAVLRHFGRRFVLSRLHPQGHLIS